MELNDLLKLMVKKKASDLHITVGLAPQLRIDGRLQVLTELPPLTPQETRDLAFSVLSDEQKQKFAEKKELDASMGIKDLGRFRINIYRQRGSIGMAIRLIPFEIPDLDELGLPKAARIFADKINGLVLITGATGSGKSTTLASMIEYINSKRSSHIISIEDPIEYLHKHKKSTINQRELGTDTASFQAAIKHVFRQDPNIVLIGELRDLDTIKGALTLAETGHLIFGTLHTIDAVHAISRIIDVFPAYQQQQVRMQLSMVLVGVMVQQLIPRKDQKGRVLAAEVMNVIPAIQSLIRENNLHQIYSLLQMGRKYEMCTMNQSLAELYNRDIVTWEEVYSRSSNPQELVSLVKR
ncbi:MAG: type IV pilus twitching motility protein PilT [Candidatus Omnitrophica bacterium]|nr:type IV pilus twitching motility protein PilT [Candidatus Omnitrophota bacterium]MBU1932705.1 type IV pilus twitching motility protein PilT [Candidatus Omnitrophota bacterium]